DRLRELVRRLLARVALEHAQLGLHDLPERPQADARAVGERPAAPPGGELGIGLDDAEELRHEPALPDAPYADDGHELRPLLAAHELERAHELVELLGATDQRPRR